MAAWIGYIFWNLSSASIALDDVLFSAAVYGGGVSLAGFIMGTALDYGLNLLKIRKRRVLDLVKL